MRYLLILAAIAALAGCSSQYHELASTSKDDPIWQLNDGKWNFNENALMRPVGETP